VVGYINRHGYFIGRPLEIYYTGILESNENGTFSPERNRMPEKITTPKFVWGVVY
jgi:hypothetical protein